MGIMAFRRDTVSGWATSNPVLMEFELAIEIETVKLKRGDGTTAWNDLAYYDWSELGLSDPEPWQGVP
jgi:hypothetical protein